MLVTINLNTVNGIISYSGDINFSPEELPYGAQGFGFNGSSTASENTLSDYWLLAKSILQNNNITEDKYITLQSISTGENFYGIKS